mmetsp:Transcript_51614/g.121137  ORF Transcript_51614/g.121137 Transcript_51614/m.121137 type:complete len:286 (-) Transcript_51614:261-1118(-)
MTMAREEVSRAAQAPAVQESCLSEVSKTGAPWKKVWFRVYDFPSPVLPKIETTLMPRSGWQASRRLKCSSLSTQSSSSWFSRGNARNPPCFAAPSSPSLFLFIGISSHLSGVLSFASLSCAVGVASSAAASSLLASPPPPCRSITCPSNSVMPSDAISPEGCSALSPFHDGHCSTASPAASISIELEFCSLSPSSSNPFEFSPVCFPGIPFTFIAFPAAFRMSSIVWFDVSSSFGFFAACELGFGLSSAKAISAIPEPIFPKSAPFPSSCPPFVAAGSDCAPAAP